MNKYTNTILKVGVASVLFFVLSFGFVSANVENQKTIEDDATGAAKINDLKKDGKLQEFLLDRAGIGIYGLDSNDKSRAPGDGSLTFYLGVYVRAFLTMLGVVFTIIITYASFTWILAGGNEDDVNKAKLYLRNSVIGLIISISAYAIVQFFLNRFYQALDRNS
jgi:hypothetical protein